MLIDAKTVDKKVINEAITELTRELRRRGMFMRIGKNFETFLAAIDRTPNRSSVHEQFDPSGNMDGACDAFWICGYDDDGELLHTQAAQLLDLRDSSISTHIQQHTHNYFPKKPPVINSTIKATKGPKGSKINGMVSYHGEMWLREDHRDQATAAIAIRLGLMLMLREWNPDAVFGLMSWSLACQGFNMRIGYHHSEPLALSWDRMDKAAQHQLWLVYLEREDMHFLMQLPILEFSTALSAQFS